MAPVVRMRALISGSRNGKKWPKPGQTIEVPEAEAAQLIAQGIAEDPATVQTATADGGAEQAVATGNKSLASIRDKVKTALADEAKAKADAEKAAAEKAAAEAKAAEAAKEKTKTPAPKTKES